METLQAVRNPFGGVQVDCKDFAAPGEVFERVLGASVAVWSGNGLKVVWLRIPATRPELIGIAMAQGFELHHCSTTELTLTRRLVQGAYVPHFATHTIGVGGVVLWENREVLTVVEAMDMVERPGHFKLPGGMLEPGEHIADGVMREVFEETGIRTAFEGMLGMRHVHRGQFGVANIYAVCRLQPLTREITIDEVEIGRALWMPVDEYLALESVGLLMKRVVAAAMEPGMLASIKIPGHMSAPGDYEILVPDFRRPISSYTKAAVVNGWRGLCNDGSIQIE